MLSLVGALLLLGSAGHAQAFLVDLGSFQVTGPFTLNPSFNFNMTDDYGTFGTMTTSAPGVGIFSGITPGMVMSMNIPELYIYGGPFPRVPVPAMIWQIGGFSIMTTADFVAGPPGQRLVVGFFDVSGNGFNYASAGNIVNNWQFPDPIGTAPITMRFVVQQENGLPAVPEAGGTLGLLALACLLAAVIDRRYKKMRLEGEE